MDATSSPFTEKVWWKREAWPWHDDCNKWRSPAVCIIFIYIYIYIHILYDIYIYIYTYIYVVNDIWLIIYIWYICIYIYMVYIWLMIVDNGYKYIYVISSDLTVTSLESWLDCGESSPHDPTFQVSEPLKFSQMRHGYFFWGKWWWSYRNIYIYTHMYTVNLQQPTELWKKDKRPKNDRRPPVYHGKNTVAFDCCSIIPFFHNYFLSKILSAWTRQVILQF